MRLKGKIALITSAQNPCAQAIAAGFAQPFKGSRACPESIEGFKGSKPGLGRELLGFGNSLNIEIRISPRLSPGA
jgi:hypothetical protein